MTPIRIAIDILGGDAAPTTLVRGALDATAGAPGMRKTGSDPAKLIFFGPGDAVATLLDGTPHEVVDVPRRVEVDDPLRGSLRGDIDSSMRSAVSALAAGDVDALVSAGSTGALVALSRHLVGMLPGIRRPAIMKSLGGADGRRFRMLDLGANIGSGPGQLHQFALLGTAAATVSDVGGELGRNGAPMPSVGLLNIGSEVRKGPATVREAARLVKADRRLRYAGFVEPHRLFDAATDVVVADGFAGNIALKSAEGAAQMARYMLGRELSGNSPGVTLGRAMLRGRLRRVRDAYNPQSYNGASLLGIAGVVVKSHGGADRQGFENAVRQTMEAHANGLVARLAAGV